jgi:hypothetical protein
MAVEIGEKEEASSVGSLREKLPAVNGRIMRLRHVSHVLEFGRSEISVD